MTIKYIQPISLAYHTHESIEGLSDTFIKILKWTHLSRHTGSVIRVYQENFMNKPREHVKMDIGVQIYEPIDLDENIMFKDIIPNHCIIKNAEIDITDFSKTWVDMYEWMLQNKYKPSLTPPFELILNNYNEHPQKKCIVEFYIPIEEPNFDNI